MAWTVYADDFELADFTSPNKATLFIPNKNIFLVGVRTTLVIYQDPVFTGISASIYSVENNAPSFEIAASTDARTKAEMHTEANGVKSTYFSFNSVALQKDTTYAFVIQGTGYLPTDNSYIAWKLAFPDPIYPDPGFSYGLENINRCPYDISLIAGEI